MSIRERLEEEARDLRAIRDELNVQVHLGKLEAQDRWNELEKRWEHAELKLKQVGEAGREVAADITEATEMVLDEIRRGYEKLKAAL